MTLISVTGVQLYRWHEQGITDIDDLQWLCNFYCKVELSRVIIMFNITQVQRWYDEQRPTT